VTLSDAYTCPFCAETSHNVPPSFKSETSLSLHIAKSHHYDDRKTRRHTVTVTISLPPAFLEKARSHSTSSGYVNFSEYVRTLLHNDIERGEQ
jgi:hypothetical protein